MDKLNHIRKVHYREIPSVKYDIYSNLTLKNGLHVTLINNKNQSHRFYLPESFKTNISLYGLSKSSYSQYDLIAFHIFRYAQVQLSFTHSQWKILWRLLLYSNSFIIAIVKTIKLIKAYKRVGC